MKEFIELVKKYWVGLLLSGICLVVLNMIYKTVCFSKILFGIPCPACGITRAAVLMLTGHFKESFQMHPLMILIPVGFISYIIIKKRLKNYSQIIKNYVIICLVIFIGFYIYRMKMYFPNVEPMVYWKDNYLHHVIVLINKYKQNLL